MIALRTLLWAATLSACAACYTTPVALIDEGYGHEHVIDQRSAHVESLRARIRDPRDGAEGSLIYRFDLLVELRNNSDQEWTIRRSDWQFVPEPCQGEQCPPGLAVQLAGTSEALQSLAPAASAAMRLPIDIHVKPPNTLRDIERHPIGLTLRDGDNILLARRVSVGEFDQLGQAFRMVGIITASLVVLSFL